MTSKPLAEALEEAFQHCRDMDASLSKRLDTLALAVRKLSPPFADAVDRSVTRLQKKWRRGDKPPKPARIVTIDN